MFRFLRGAAAPGIVRRFALALLALLASSFNAAAHWFIGRRFFPATIADDDLCVAD
jgi:hypothetical protein